MQENYYFYYSDSNFTEHGAHLGHNANSANAVANLGFPSLLGYHEALPGIQLPKVLHPFAPQAPSEKLIKRYSIQSKIKVVKLPIPWPFGRVSHKLTATSTLICKYYLPVFIRPAVRVVHSRNWNFIKAAVKNKIPAIYEHHHYVNRKFEPEIVNSPYFRVTVTVAQPVLDSLVATGMPPEKIVMLHSGFNQNFLGRHPEKAQQWRAKILSNSDEKLVIYAGGLYGFKGVDLLLEVAQQLPTVKFAIAGGKDSQIQHYQHLIQSMQLENVTLLGCLPHTDLSPLLQAADLLAHPHLATREATFTSPLKFFEYMASGTPIVASKIVTLQEFTKSPASVVWCDPDDPKEFAQSIQFALDHYPRRTDGYSDTLAFVNQFSWESRMKTILSYVEKAA